MELVKDYKEIIRNLVKANPKYSGNEDLLEDFCSETYQKSYLILQSVTDEKSLTAYLKKVVSSAIMDVLKNNGRITRSSSGYKNIKEISISSEAKSVDEETTDADNYNIVENSFDTIQERAGAVETTPKLVFELANIKDPKESIEEQIIRKDIIENIINMVKQIDAEQPQEMYLKIFYLRYFLNKKQKDIAQETGISQSETSKRLVNLSSLIKEKLY